MVEELEGKEVTAWHPARGTVTFRVNFDARGRPTNVPLGAEYEDIPANVAYVGTRYGTLPYPDPRAKQAFSEAAAGHVARAAAPRAPEREAAITGVERVKPRFDERDPGRITGAERIVEGEPARATGVVGKLKRIIGQPQPEAQAVAVVAPSPVAQTQRDTAERYARQVSAYGSPAMGRALSERFGTGELAQAGVIGEVKRMKTRVQQVPIQLGMRPSEEVVAPPPVPPAAQPMTTRAGVVTPIPRVSAPPPKPKEFLPTPVIGKMRLESKTQEFVVTWPSGRSTRFETRAQAEAALTMVKKVQEQKAQTLYEIQAPISARLLRRPTEEEGLLEAVARGAVGIADIPFQVVGGAEGLGIAGKRAFEAGDFGRPGYTYLTPAEREVYTPQVVQLGFLAAVPVAGKLVGIAAKAALPQFAAKVSALGAPAKGALAFGGLTVVTTAPAAIAGEVTPTQFVGYTLGGALGGAAIGAGLQRAASRAARKFEGVAFEEPVTKFEVKPRVGEKLVYGLEFEGVKAKISLPKPKPYVVEAGRITGVTVSAKKGLVRAKARVAGEFLAVKPKGEPAKTVFVGKQVTEVRALGLKIAEAEQLVVSPTKPTPPKAIEFIKAPRKPALEAPSRLAPIPEYLKAKRAEKQLFGIERPIGEVIGEAELVFFKGTAAEVKTKIQKPVKGFAKPFSEAELAAARKRFGKGIEAGAVGFARVGKPEKPVFFKTVSLRGRMPRLLFAEKAAELQLLKGRVTKRTPLEFGKEPPAAPLKQVKRPTALIRGPRARQIQVERTKAITKTAEAVGVPIFAEPRLKIKTFAVPVAVQKAVTPTREVQVAPEIALQKKRVVPVQVIVFKPIQIPKARQIFPQVALVTPAKVKEIARVPVTGLKAPAKLVQLAKPKLRVAPVVKTAPVALFKTTGIPPYITPFAYRARPVTPPAPIFGFGGVGAGAGRRWPWARKEKRKKVKTGLIPIPSLGLVAKWESIYKRRLWLGKITKPEQKRFYEKTVTGALYFPKKLPKSPMPARFKRLGRGFSVPTLGGHEGIFAKLKKFKKATKEPALGFAGKGGLEGVAVFKSAFYGEKKTKKKRKRGGF